MKTSSSSTCIVFFQESLNEENRKVLNYIENFRKTQDIFERTKIALGREVPYRSLNSASNNVNIIKNGISSTNKI